MTSPDALTVLKALVGAHTQRQPDTGARIPIMHLKHLGGATLDHHALDDPPAVDDALLEELSYQGYLDIDYREHNWNLTPTASARTLVEQHQRVLSLEPIADLQPVLDAVAAQAGTSNKLAWPAVRPMLAALREYWEAGGFSTHGVAMPAILATLPEEHEGLFIATIRALVGGDYLVPTTDLSANDMPAEVSFSDRKPTTDAGAEPGALWPTRSARLASLVDGDRLGEQHLGRAPACVPGELGSAGQALRADAAQV